MSEPHAVVKLLLARMESHPEEFKSYVRGRWDDVVNEITEYGNETDKAAINAKLRDIRLDEAHADALDELCNGPERRRVQQEEIEYERQLIMQKAAAQRQTTQMAAQQYASQYGDSVGSFGKPLTAARHPTSADMENNGIMNALRKTFK